MVNVSKNPWGKKARCGRNPGSIRMKQKNQAVSTGGTATEPIHRFRPQVAFLLTAACPTRPGGGWKSGPAEGGQHAKDVPAAPDLFSSDSDSENRWASLKQELADERKAKHDLEMKFHKQKADHQVALLKQKG